MLFKIRIFIIIILTWDSISSQNSRIPPPPCYANDNTGAGGVIGNGYYLGGYDGTTLQFGFNLGTDVEGVEFNDVFVLYIATGAAGRSVIDNTVDDDADSYRIAITNSNAYGYGSNVYFPSGFEVNYAIAIDTNSGGLYGIPSSGSVGTGGLNFISSVNSTLTSNTQESFLISFDCTDIGLNSEDEFAMFGVYVSHTGYTYDEGYIGITAGTQGSDDIIFNGDFPYESCWGYGTLNANEFDKSNFKAYYFDGELHISGINDLTRISIFDLFGRKISSTRHQIFGSKAIPIKLNRDQLQLIVIETNNKRKILKVIPK